MACDLGHNREQSFFFFYGIIKPGMDYSQTAKDITKEKIGVVDGLCVQWFVIASSAQSSLAFFSSSRTPHLPI